MVDKEKYVQWYRVAQSVLGDLAPSLAQKEIIDQVSPNDWLIIPAHGERSKQQSVERPEPNIYFSVNGATGIGLEFVLERVKGIGEEMNRDEAIVKKAAFLFHSIIVQHPFINGNKRTAVEVVESFLQLNGYELRAGTEETYRFLADIGAGNASQRQVETWIGTNLAKKTRKSRRDR